MGVRIIRKKRLFEDDATAQQPANNAGLQQPANNGQQGNQEMNDTQKKVLEILKQMENQYWLVTVDLPTYIKEQLPDFKADNQAAKPACDLWSKFKQDPKKETFDAFVEEFKKFGTPSPEEQLNLEQNQQQAQLLNNGQQPAQQNTLAQPATGQPNAQPANGQQQAAPAANNGQQPTTTPGNESAYVPFNFSLKLNENLKEAVHKKYINECLSKY